MRLVESSIRYPVTVAVGVLIAFFGGLLAISGVPIQLVPDIDKSIVTVSTVWPGASPEEIEKEIVEEQEKFLKSVEGVLEMRSVSQDSRGSITLEFVAGTDIDAATLKVANKLGEVGSYPQTADRPVISSADRFERVICWYVIRSTRDDVYVPHLQSFVEDVVKPQLERAEGVSGVNLFGGRGHELHVTYDPDLLASIGITISELASALRAESQDVSAGDIGQGKRRYVVRTMGRYRSPEDVARAVVKVRGGVPIRVGDVAEVELDYEKQDALVRLGGEPAIALNVQRQIGTNVLEVTHHLDAAEARINEEILLPRGMKLENVSRTSTYIEDSIDRVLRNIYLGAFLAIAILFVFLRSPTSILVVAASIPISVVTSFLTMYLLGRSMNVISLAGMSFAVGMVVDNAIVVLENIYRHLQMGKGRREAAHEGTREVWGAVFASTVTTIAVFLPLLFIQERAAQLFRDIALAISSAIVVSLLVALTVIPSASARVLKASARSREGEKTRLMRLADAIAALVGVLNAGRWRRLVVTVALVALSVGFTWALLPSAEYLPNGNQNFIFGILLPPPGYNLEEVERIAEVVEAELRYLWEASDEEARDLPGAGARHFWYIGVRSAPFFGFEARDPDRVRELVPVVNESLGVVPGSMGFAAQESLFSDSFAGTRSVRIDVTGPDLDEVLALTGEVFLRTLEVLPGSNSRPEPGLDLGNPEVRVHPDRVRAADAGFTTAEIGETVNSLIDGMKVAEYFHEGREVDLILKGDDERSRYTHDVARLPLATPSGRVITLGDIAEVRELQGPIQINHVERQRAVSIETALPDDIPLEDAIVKIENEIVAPLREAGRIGGLYNIQLRGAADDLSRLRGALQTNFVVVLGLTFLLLAALFQSFVYPAVIMLTVPLATCGGVLGLRLVQTFVPGQQMDILTMLGFVILVGTVINNSILIVYQALNLVRGGMASEDAVQESVRLRVRPILMSTMTSSLGMLPMVVMPGAGSELYRGLGSVVVGGLVISTVITLVLTPLVFSFVYEWRQAVSRRLGFGAVPVAVDSAPAV